jgi:hypothetical protein
MEGAAVGIEGGGGSQTGYHFRDALRLLFILVRGSVPVGDAGHQRVFVGEKRAMAIDFLIRYPDYLADKLLDLYEATQDATALAAARKIFDQDEPDVRLVKMIRWRRGAFQNMETALAILQARDLVRPVVRGRGSDRKQYEFIVLPAAQTFIAQATQDQPSLKWYDDRMEMVMRIAGDRSGSSLKDDQYESAEYRDTPYGATIPSIKERVLARLATIERRP